MSGPKGIDDLFLVGGNPRLRRQHRVAADVSKPRFPHELPERAPTRGGRPLREVRAEIAGRIDLFVSQSPRWSGRALPIVADPGTGKTTAASAAVKKYGAKAGFVFGTRDLADEFSLEHGFLRIRERNRDTCLKPALVATLAQQGFPVGKLACGTEEAPACEFRAQCPYFKQFEAPGSRVGTTEQIFSPRFTDGLDVLVVDDANLERALIKRREVSLEGLQKAVQQLEGKRREPARSLCLLLAQGLLEMPARGFMAGPFFWDYLSALAARGGRDLVEMVRSLPTSRVLLSPFDELGELTVDSVLAVPPANLSYVLAALKEELRAFLSGEDFNSRLRLSATKLEVAHLREHSRDREGFHISRSSMLILDATPTQAMLAPLTRHHAVLPPVRGEVLIPANVRVIQYATASNGHTSLGSRTNVESVKREIQAERARSPVPAEHEALISFSESLADFRDLGFLQENTLHFGSARGTNALEQVRRLHVVGRPFPPPDDIWYLAQVLHHGDAFVERDILVRAAEYGGQAWAVDVPDFKDARLAELLGSFREAELWQVIHRARPTLVAEDGRTCLTISIHTTHPIPSLPVDELVQVRGRRTVNDDRRDLAELELRRAMMELKTTGNDISQRALARHTGLDRKTVAKHLDRHRKVAHTHIKERSKGVGHVPMSSPPSDGLCRGGCGRAMPEGQSCSRCAERAVEEWKRRQRRGAG